MENQALIENWEKIKESIKIEHKLSEISYKTWISPLNLYGVEDDTVIILIPSGPAQSVKYIDSKFNLPFKVAISEFLQEEYDIKFILENDVNKYINEFNENKVLYEKANINHRYSFDTFVVGDNNILARNAALAVADAPGEIYNPLFIYGGVGLGKTHLMHSIAHHIIDNTPDANVLYVTSEAFTNEVVEAIRIGNNSPTAMKNLREKYRNVDVLLIDDIQFIIGKESTQIEFFNTFNHLHELKKQIVISSDKPPKDMEFLEERFRSRFNMGLTADIQSPAYETRLAILKNRLEIDGYSIDDNILTYIAENVTTNIRDLEGSLNKIIAYSKLQNLPIDIEMAKKALSDIITQKAPKTITPEYIIDIVCEHFNLSKEEITSKKRNNELVVPRQIIMYLCRKLTPDSSTRIASLLKRDHTTILHGETKIIDDMKFDTSLKNTVEVLLKKMNVNNIDL